MLPQPLHLKRPGLFHPASGGHFKRFHPAHTTPRRKRDSGHSGPALRLPNATGACSGAPAHSGLTLSLAAETPGL